MTWSMETTVNLCIWLRLSPVRMAQENLGLIAKMNYGPETEMLLFDPVAARLRANSVPARVADILAGRSIVRRLKQLEQEPCSFVHETNMAERNHRGRVRRLRKVGYDIQVMFVGLRNPDTAVGRVAARVRDGGHDVPEKTIRERWSRGLGNFLGHHRFHANYWSLYDNQDEMLEIARGGLSAKPELEVVNEGIWMEYKQLYEQMFGLLEEDQSHPE